MKSIYPEPCPSIPPALMPTHPHSVCLCTPSSTSPFLQTRTSNTLPYHSHPRSLQEAKGFQCPERTIKGWGPVHFLPEAAVPMGDTFSLIFSTWSREKENRRKGDSYVLTDQGSSLLKASCFLFFFFHPPCWRSEGRNDRQSSPLLPKLPQQPQCRGRFTASQPEVKPVCCESLLRAPSSLPLLPQSRQQSSSGLQRGAGRGEEGRRRRREGMNSIPFCKHTNRTSEVCETELERGGQERSPET